MFNDEYNHRRIAKAAPVMKVTLGEIVDSCASAGIDLRQLAAVCIARADAAETGIVKAARAASAGVAAQRGFKLCGECPDPAGCRKGASCATESRGKAPGAKLIDLAKAAAAAHSRRPR